MPPDGEGKGGGYSNTAVILLLMDVFLIDRNVEQVATFSGIGERRSLTYSVKQMLAREIEVEKLRQLEAALAPQDLNQDLNQDRDRKPDFSQEKKKGKTDGVEPQEEEEEEAPPVIPNHLQILKPKAVTQVAKVRRIPSRNNGRQIEEGRGSMNGSSSIWVCVCVCVCVCDEMRRPLSMNAGRIRFRSAGGWNGWSASSSSLTYDARSSRRLSWR